MTPDPRLRPLVVSVDPDPDRAASDPGLAEAVADGRPVLASWVVAGSDDAARVVVLFGAATREQPNPDAPKLRDVGIPSSMLRFLWNGNTSLAIALIPACLVIAITVVCVAGRLLGIGSP